MTASEEICAYCADDKHCEWWCSGNSFQPSKRVNDALDLLEKQEQGLLIELPVPIGTEYYVIDVSENKVNEETLERGNPISFVFAIAYNYGKWVFATREEAEARLKELRGEE